MSTTASAVPLTSTAPPVDRQVSASCLDFLLMEMINTIITTSPIHNESDREAAYFKCESIGYRVGQTVVEKLAKDRARFIDHLDVVKFVCKDFWIAVFRKQIDNLKTNHRGVYVLTDNSFRWFSRMSVDPSISLTSPLSPSSPNGTSSNPAAELAALKAFLFPAFPCGILRGALANLGVSSVVAAETSQLPQCTFQIKISK